MFWMILCFSLTWDSVACNGCRQGFMVAWVCIAAPPLRKNSPFAAQLKIAFRRFLFYHNLPRRFWTFVLSLQSTRRIHETSVKFCQWINKISSDRGSFYAVLVDSLHYIWRVPSQKWIPSLHMQNSLARVDSSTNNKCVPPYLMSVSLLQ